MKYLYLVLAIFLIGCGDEKNYYTQPTEVIEVETIVEKEIEVEVPGDLQLFLEACVAECPSPKVTIYDNTLSKCWCVRKWKSKWCSFE